jgi:hypothetical protein
MTRGNPQLCNRSNQLLFFKVRMVDQILFYISAAKDVENERDVLARLTTEIPVTLGWKIVFSPIKGGRIDQQSLEGANFHILMIGSDIRAPIGLEWAMARNAGRKPLLFKKSGGLRTPAAEDFLRTLQTHQEWISYKNIKELRLMVLEVLADHITENAIYYTLRPNEYTKLLDWRNGLESESKDSSEDHQGGAGESSIILSPERYVPSDGTLISNTKPHPKSEKR